MATTPRLLSPFSYPGFYRRDADYDEKNYRDIFYIVKRGLQSAELNDHRYYDFRNFTSMFQGIYADGDILKNGGYSFQNGEITFNQYRIISDGYPVDVPEQIITIPITGTQWVGINVEKYVVSAEEDPGLYDPAPPPAENTGLAGAIRLKLVGSWKRDSDPRPVGSTFYPIYSWVNGVIYNADVIDPQQSRIEDTIARYDKAANGNYVSDGTRVTYEMKKNYTPAAPALPYTKYQFSVESGTFNVQGYQYTFSGERLFEVPDMTDFIRRYNEPITYRTSQGAEYRITLESSPTDAPVAVTSLTKAASAIVTVPLAHISKFVNQMTVLVEGGIYPGFSNANGYKSIDSVNPVTGTFRLVNVSTVDAGQPLTAQVSGVTVSPPKNQLLNYIKIGENNYEYTSTATATRHQILAALATLINNDTTANSFYTATLSPANPAVELIIKSVGNVPISLPITSAYLKVNLVQGAITEYYATDYGDIKQIVSLLGTKNAPQYPENVTRQAGQIDTFASTSPLQDIIEVKYLTTVYVAGTDYNEVGNGLQWVLTKGPSQGTTYQVKYTVAATINYPTDTPGNTLVNPGRTAIKLNDFANGGTVYVTYEYWLKRRDTIMLAPEGIIYNIPGISKYENPTPISITNSKDLGIATILISRSSMNRVPTVTSIFPPAYTMREIQEIQQKVNELQMNLARSALYDNVQKQDPTNNKTNMFVDGLLDTDQMDLGAYAAYAPGEPVVALSHATIHLPVRPTYAYSAGWGVDDPKVQNWMLPYSHALYRAQLETTKSRQIVQYVWPENPTAILASVAPTNARYIAKTAALTPIASIKTVQQGKDPTPASPQTTFTTSTTNSAAAVTTITDLPSNQITDAVRAVPTPAVNVVLNAKNFLPGTTIDIIFNTVLYKQFKLDNQSGEVINYKWSIPQGKGKAGDKNTIVLQEHELIPPATAYRRATCTFEFIPQQKLTITPVSMVIHVANPPQIINNITNVTNVTEVTNITNTYQGSNTGYQSHGGIHDSSGYSEGQGMAEGHGSFGSSHGGSLSVKQLGAKQRDGVEITPFVGETVAVPLVDTGVPATEPEGGGDSVADPLGETFFPTEDLYFTKYDVVFGAVGTTPVTLMYGPTTGGVPDRGKAKNAASLMPSQIKKGLNKPDAQENWTTFAPRSPTFTDGGHEYCPYLMCNDKTSTLNVAELNINSAISGVRVAVNPFIEGVLVNSSNGSTWTPIQNEDLRFKLWRAKFTTNTWVTKDLGTVDLTKILGDPVPGALYKDTLDARVDLRHIPPYEWGDDNIKLFTVGQTVYITGADGVGFSAANGQNIVKSVVSIPRTPPLVSSYYIELTGVNTGAATKDYEYVDIQPEKTVTNVTDLMLMVGVIGNANTKVIFRLKLMGRDVSGGGTFVPETHEVLPYESIMIAPYSGSIKIEALMWSADDHVTPEVDEDVRLMCGKVAPSASYISKEFSVSGDLLKFFIEIYQPSGTEVNVMFQKGTKWMTLGKDPDYAVPKDNGFIEYSYSSQIAPAPVTINTFTHGAPPTVSINSADVAAFKNGQSVTIAGVGAVQVSITNLSSSNPTVVTVGTGDIAKFKDLMYMEITGCTGFPATTDKANGWWVIDNVNQTTRTFTLMGCDTSGGAAVTNSVPKIWPSTSNVNGTWPVVNVNATTNTFQLQGCVSTIPAGTQQTTGVMTATINGLLVEGVNRTRLRVQLVGHREDANGVWTTGFGHYTQRPMARAFRVYVSDTTL